MTFLAKLKQSFGSTFPFSTDSWAELKKVRWPNRKELTSYTIVVLITVMVVTIYFWVLDIGISALVEADCLRRVQRWLDMEKRWYVVHTYSGYENKVKANLEKRVESMGMEDKIFRVLVPMEEEVVNKDGKKKTVMRKVYPGYVLVEMVQTDDSWYVVRNTPGVTGFVGSTGSGSKPTAIVA